MSLFRVLRCLAVIMLICLLWCAPRAEAAQGRLLFGGLKKAAQIVLPPYPAARAAGAHVLQFGKAVLGVDRRKSRRARRQSRRQACSLNAAQPCPSI